MNLPSARTIVAQDALKARPGLRSGFLTRDDVARRHVHLGLSFRQARDVVDQTLDGRTAARQPAADPPEQQPQPLDISTSASRLAALLPLEKAKLDGGLVETVDARKLHAWLGVGRDFSNWIKGRIEIYGFVEGFDYAVIDSPDLANQSRRGGDRRSKEYHLTLGMARELAMVENNDHGRAARRYFIRCEQMARAAIADQLGGAGISRDVLGGIVKGVLGKQLAPIEVGLAAVADSVALLPDLMVQVAALAAHFATSTPQQAFWGPRPGGFASSRDVVLALGGDPRRLRSLSAMVSNALWRASLAGSAVTARCPLDGRRLFAPHIVAQWLDSGGRERIR